jgi:porin
MRPMRSAALAALLMSAITAAPAAADEPAPYGDTLFGDWAGLRGRLYADGIDLRVGYVSETAANVQGGSKTGVRYTDQYTFGSTFDLDKLLGLNHALFQVSITDRNGRNLSSDVHLDTLQQVQEVFGRGQTWRITQFWYRQTYLDNALDVKLGRLTEGEDFASFSCEFMNLTFCGAPPGNIVGSYWYNWPVSQWAGRVKLLSPDFGYAQIGAYEVNPSYLSRRYAFNLGDPPGATGALIPAELAWVPSFGPAKLAGSYKIGAWYNTSQTADVVNNTQGQILAIAGGQPFEHNGAYGAYVNFQQKITEGAAAPDQGMSVFLNITAADRRTATLDNQVALGVFYNAPFDSRPADQLGIALGRTHVNGRVAVAEQAENAVGLGPVGIQHSEYSSEVYYRLHVIDGLTLQPNLQYVHQPGGIAKNTDDIILGLRVAISL